LTTKGAPVVKPLTSTPFHQELISQDCVACHSDHAGVKRYHLKGYFDHALLKKETSETSARPATNHPRRAAQANHRQLRAVPHPEEVDPRHV
jgi:hypothetical protein